MPRFATALTSAPFASSHLSDEAVAAFADGVLRDGARTRAEQHLSNCAECREAVRDQRAASAVLRAAPPPCLPTGLADRLRNLPATTSVPPSPFTPAALTPDNQPLFAAFHTVQAAARAEYSLPTETLLTETLSSEILEATARQTSSPSEHGAVDLCLPAASTHRALLHRRPAAGAGLGVMAVSAVAVTLLGSTAASAGGAKPPASAPMPAAPTSAASSSSAGASDIVGGVHADIAAVVDSLDLTEPR